ncbi:MAG: hydroxymethylbilane synthase, partial [Phycisphaerae bacterium]|nr:hydroxymethylbilane synthase [Phycisphaerae bacterium]
MRRIRIATRTSILAQRQAALVAEAIRSIDETIDTELVLLGTAGDARSVKVSEIGGKGIFTAELEAALRAGKVDLAVHSAKDLPVAMAEDLQIAAVPPRD